MLLIEKIKADCLVARKARQAITAASLITLIGEAERVGKDAGGRSPTDSEVTTVLLKFVKNLAEVIKLRPNDEASKIERVLLESYLPSRLTGETLNQAVRAAAFAAGLTSISGKDIGAVMKALALEHPGAYDGAEASAAVRALSA